VLPVVKEAWLEILQALGLKSTTLAAKKQQSIKGQEVVVRSKQVSPNFRKSTAQRHKVSIGRLQANTEESAHFMGSRRQWEPSFRKGGVANGTRTRNNKLHKLGLYH
jgi:hypothetical protein